MMCIGAQFALAEAALVLSRLVETFRIELVSRKPVMPVAIVTTQLDHHPTFGVLPRQSANRDLRDATQRSPGPGQSRYKPFLGPDRSAAGAQPVLEATPETRHDQPIKVDPE